ncbi:MAG: hypothetical protein LBI53_08175 [Candidatus Peribacteria bacterium]|jgi:hypothetical protein|nr:hypothetical protein [Candidatus Peribacteria bacterium]
MLKIVQGKQNASAEATVKDLSNTLKKQAEEQGKSFAGLENNLPDQDNAGISTKIVEKTIRESYLIDYPNLFSSQNGIVRRDNILAGGRRVDEYKDSEGQSQLKAKVDSSSNSILTKDTINIGNDSIKGILTNFNDLLERAVDKKITDKKYDMDIVIPTEYRNRYHMRRRYWIGWLLLPIFIPQEKRFNTTYKVYYFGKEAKLINSAQELSIYRGSFRNLTSLSGVNYSTLPSSNINPTKST